MTICMWQYNPHYTVSKKWGTHIVPHNSHKNQSVDHKSISYNLPLKSLMQWSTSCSHCHDNQVTCHSPISLLGHTRIHLVRPLTSWTALTWSLLTTEFGAVSKTGCIKNVYVMLMSWNSVCLRCGHTSVRPSLMRSSMRGGSDFWDASEWRDIISNIWCKLNVG